ncbi:MAG TPA: hypothetical protein ACFYD6_08090 [Candidatus Brocadiia bacterium]|nr:hypothetical protein [Candidatus Brocadiales bacterium]
MFSNKLYYLKFSVTLAIILGACLYSFLTLRYSENPSENTNIICKYRKVSDVGENYFTYGWHGRKTTVFGDISDIKKGDYVSFTASFLNDGNLKLNSFHVHKYRNYAMYVSLPPIIVVFWIIAKRLKWSKKGLRLMVEG